VSGRAAACRFALLVILTAAAPAAMAADAGAGPRAAAVPLEGAWTGALQLGVVRLRVVLNLRRTPQGWSATLDSIDQNKRDIPTSAVTVQGHDLNVDVPVVGGRTRRPAPSPNTARSRRRCHPRCSSW